MIVHQEHRLELAVMVPTIVQVVHQVAVHQVVDPLVAAATEALVAVVAQVAVAQVAVALVDIVIPATRHHMINILTETERL